VAPPPPPWHSEVEALLWLGPAQAGPARELPPALGGRPAPPVVLGGLIAYRSGPVGPYAEVFAALGLVWRGGPAGHVPFMAVDSAASVAGGRGNWALPKELATFAGDRRSLGFPGRTVVRGNGWSLEAAVRMRPRALPLAAAGACVQAWEDGVARRFGVVLRGRGRLASVDVRAGDAGPLPPWLAPGRRPALLLAGSQVVGPPRPGPG